MISLLLTALATASPPDEVPVVDVSEFTDDIAVLDDGEGNLIAYRRSAPRDAVWFGDREHLYALNVYSSSASGDESWSVMARDFRSPTRQTSVVMRDGDITMACADNQRALTPLSPSDAQRVARRATFHEARWRRNLVGAWRDEWGVYYVIDRASGDDDNRDHRVYMGWTGEMLRSGLSLIAADSVGRVYAGGNGTYRLVITGDKARYIEGEGSRELHTLDLTYDGPYLYTDVGVYGDAPHGTPCDVLLTSE